MSAWIVDVQGGRHPYLPAGNRLRTGFPAFTSEGSQSLRAFQTAQRPLRLCRTACLGKRRRRESPLFWDMLGTPCAPAVAILPSAMYLPKRTSIRAKKLCFLVIPFPRGEGITWPWPGPRHSPKGSRSSHFPRHLLTVPTGIRVALELGPGVRSLQIAKISKKCFIVDAEDS